MLRNSSGETFSMDINSLNRLEELKNKQDPENENEVNLKSVLKNNAVKCLARTIEKDQSSPYESGDQLCAPPSELLKCLVSECGVSQRCHPDKHFFSLPSNEERLHHWLLVCRRPDLIENLKETINSHYGVCENHFIADNFVDNTKSTLKCEAIPTIFSSDQNTSPKYEFFDDDDDDDEEEMYRETDADIKEEQQSYVSDNTILDEIEHDFEGENMGQLCRLCASSISDVVYIFNDLGQEQQIAEKINSCLPVTVKRTDPLPKQLCMSCVAKLNLCHEFAESCIEAENKLLHLNKRNYFKSSLLSLKKEEYHYCNESLDESSDLRQKYSGHLLPDYCKTLDEGNSFEKYTHGERYGCPLCFGGSMLMKQRPKSPFVISTELDHETREKILNDSLMTNRLPNNDYFDSDSLKEDDHVETEGYYRSIEETEEKQDNDLKSNLQNEDENGKKCASNYVCRICDGAFETVDLCISHAETHFNSGFYPCNLCDLCFTSQSSFKGHCENEHIRIKSQTKTSKRSICNRCGKRFNSEKNLKGHSCGSSPRPYRCDECGKNFLTEVRLLFHQQTHQGGSAIRCEQCGKMFSRENNLFDHVRLVHMGEKAHCCDQCGKTFQLKARLIAHQRVHTGERPFECSVCGGKFYDKATLKGHHLTHLEVKPFQCETCGRCFARKSLFKQHTLAHATEERKRPRTYSCKLCGGVFQSYSKLLCHRKQMHPNADINEVDEGGQGSKPFKCEDCGKSFAYRVTLVAHRRNHTGELPFQCEFCSKRFSQKRSLILHRRTHTGEKPFVCMECGKRFVQSAHLYSHMRLHTGEKPYSCELCGESFRLKDVRDAHQRKHTGERPYKCSDCGKAFRTSHSYYQHMWIHQGKKPYPCSYCGKAFRRSNGLKIHIRIHTGEKPHSCDICGRSFTQKQDMKKHRNLHMMGKV